MEDLSEPLLAEIITRITRTSDLNSLSLVSKWFYTVEAEERATLRVGCGLQPATEALLSLCSRFPNLQRVEINYSCWTSSQGEQLDNQGLLVLSSCCLSLTDLTLRFCSFIDDSGLGYLAYCKKLMALRLDAIPAITSSGLFLVAVGCKSLSTFHLADCMKVGSVEAVSPQHECEQFRYGSSTQQQNMGIKCPGDTGMEWLEYLGRAGLLVELVVKNCKGISQYDLLKFGPGWRKLQKFEFVINDHDPSYNVDYPYNYYICCENMKDLRLAKIATRPKIGPRFLSWKCRALEKLCLHYVVGLNESEMIALFQNCGNLRSISLRLMPLRCGISFRTPLTDDSLKVLSLCCPMLEVVELPFTFCSTSRPTEIGFTQKGIVTLIQTCSIRVFVLNGASIFKDEGMKDISSALLLETLELVDCKGITDVGISYLAHAPCLTSLTLRKCKNVTSVGMAKLVHFQKLESLAVVGCRLISEEAVQGLARSVHYSAEFEGYGSLKGMENWS
ncbi:F-box/LRR-repeat protein 14-like [Panicum virgatum]|nr:F-box/LRR-repeat protein 14-like [Panicum virgatum]